jgi:anti-sigma factor RsiW
MTTGLNAECRRVLVSISAYLDGDLTASACESIETHCGSCVTCADLIAGLRETVGVCRQAGSVPVPEVVRQRARASVRRLLDANGTDPLDATDEAPELR